MGAKAFPAIGEAFQGNDPGAQRVTKIVVGASPRTDCDVSVSTAGTYKMADIAVGVVIDKIRCVTPVGWTVNLTLTVGDVDSAAGYLADNDINPGVADTTGILVNSAGGGEAYAAGRKYTAARALNAVSGVETALIGKSVFFVAWHQEDDTVSP